MLEIQYPAGTMLTVTLRVWDQRTDRVTDSSSVVASATLDAYNNYYSGPTYHFDSGNG